MLESSVSCGFPSPASDFVEKTLDINNLIVKNYAATFFVRAKGESMKDAGIFSGDLLVVDRSLTAKKDDIVVAAIDSDLVVKRLKSISGTLMLCSENEFEEPISIALSNHISFWGVVTFVIHGFRQPAQDAKSI